MCKLLDETPIIGTEAHETLHVSYTSGDRPVLYCSYLLGVGLYPVSTNDVPQEWHLGLEEQALFRTEL